MVIARLVFFKLVCDHVLQFYIHCQGRKPVFMEMYIYTVRSTNRGRSDVSCRWLRRFDFISFDYFLPDCTIQSKKKIFTKPNIVATTRQ